jgi:hypothetical protein
MRKARFGIAAVALAMASPTTAKVIPITLQPSGTTGVYVAELPFNPVTYTGLANGAPKTVDDAYTFTLTSSTFITTASLSASTSSLPATYNGKPVTDPELAGTFSLYQGSPYSGTAVTPVAGGANGTVITGLLSGSAYSYGAGIGEFLLDPGSYYFEVAYSYNPYIKSGVSYVNVPKAAGSFNGNASFVAAPELSTWRMLGLGLAGFGLLGFRRRKDARHAL